MGVRKASALILRWSREWGCQAESGAASGKEPWQKQLMAVGEAQQFRAALGRVSGSLSLLSDLLYLFLLWCDVLNRTSSNKQLRTG